jgi:hypothetical protein
LSKVVIIWIISPVLTNSGMFFFEITWCKNE